MKRKSTYIISILALGIVMGLLIATKLDFTNHTDAKDSDFTKPTAAYVSGHDLEKSTIDVAQEVGKAVVSISMEKTEKIGGGSPHVRRYYFGFPFQDEREGPFEDDFFQRFFDDFFGGFPEREFKQRGLGSGVIISNEGYILTNEHVVANADKLTVTLSDGREFRAEIKGTDPRSDLAIIKINAKELPVVTLGDSDNVKIGQWVLAVGNPFGYVLENPEPTVTMGVISALHRSLNRGFGRDRDYSDLIQTDAAINPGNSGGPLVNLSGQVIAINVAIFSTSGGYQGVGFAIPINSAKRIISRLIEGEKILYGWLGVNIQDINDDLMDYFGLKSKDGVLVAKVLEDTPAQKAGIKEGDIIVKLDGNDITKTNDLTKFVARTQVGKEADVQIIREKQQMTLRVKVGQRPDTVKEDNFIESEDKESWRGLKVKSLEDISPRKYRIPEKIGVVVVDVEPNSLADEAGIVPGDVILSINKNQIDNLDDYNNVTKKLKGDALIGTSRGYFVVKEK